MADQSFGRGGESPKSFIEHLAESPDLVAIAVLHGAVRLPGHDLVPVLLDGQFILQDRRRDRRAGAGVHPARAAAGRLS